MSCTDDIPAVERETVLDAPPEEVWESLPALVGDDDLAAEPGAPLRATEAEGERIGVVDEADAPRRLAFWWAPIEGDDAPSFVEITLDAVETGRGVGTLLRVRESRFDAALVADGLLRGPLAHARG
jgi:uncharacterized protein YndB with AHSA1/START domain